MKELICLILVAAFATASCAQEGNCPSCGADIKSLYAGGKTSIVDNTTLHGGLKIEKTAPTEIVKGETLTVTIEVLNTLPKEETVTLKETFGGAKEEDMGGFVRVMKNITSAPPYYKMSVLIGPGEKKTLTYRIIPLYYGKYRIPGTEASTSTEKKKSNSVTVLVKCNDNNACEADKDENALTCPHDCRPDQKDDLCDPRSDGLCDPDCPGFEDPDCAVRVATTTKVASTLAASSCGNHVCELEKNETSVICPSDCPSGGRDGFCDGIRDGRCDPDCTLSSDYDCADTTGSGFLPVLIIVLAILVLAAFYAKKWMKKRQQ